MDKQQGTIITKNLRDSTTYEELKTAVGRMAAENAWREAFDFIRAFAPQLQSSTLAKTSPDMYREYDTLVQKAQWIALPLISEKEAIQLFEKHLLIYFSLPDMVADDLGERLRAKLRGMMMLDERTALKKQIRDALTRSTTRVTAKGPVIDEKEEEGTLIHWFRDYHRAVGMSGDKLQQSQYFVRGGNLQRVTEEEKKRLQIIFHLYEKLRFPSDTIEGYEDTVGIDDEGKRGIFRDGIFETPNATQEKNLEERMRFLSSFDTAKISGEGTAVVAPPPAPPATPRSVPPPIRGAGSESAKIQAAMAQLRSRGTDAVAIFFDVLSPKQGMRESAREDIVAALLLLAEANVLEKAITAPSVRDVFIAHLKSKNAPDLLQGFRLAPAMPKFMILFLRWVLEEKAQLAENDAARVGAQLVNILKKRGNEKYGRIVYYDAASGQFRWS